MRHPVDAERIRTFLRALGAAAQTSARVYMTGGATAVLVGWRNATIDIDLKLEPEADRLLRAIVELKERLEINVELAAPDQFIPELVGWRARSGFVARQSHELSRGVETRLDSIICRTSCRSCTWPHSILTSAWA